MAYELWMDRLKLSAKVVCLAVCGLFLLTAIGSASDEWELIKSDNGIDTYRKTYPETDVCTFKGVGFVDAGMDVISSVVMDIPSYPQWVAACKESRVLKEIDRTHKIIYNVVDTPFPYHNRDAVIGTSGNFDLENATIEITFGVIDSDDLLPETDQYVRVPRLEGNYYFDFFGRHKTRVTYLYTSHPGGNILVSLANWKELRHYPQINIEGLRRMVKKEKYTEAGCKTPEYALLESMVASRTDVGEILKIRSAEFFTDPVLLDLLFEQPYVLKIIDDVHVRHATHQSIVNGVGDILIGFLEMDCPMIKGYLHEKSLADVFSMERLLREKWLIAELVKDDTLVCRLFNPDAPMAKMVFDKMTTSPSTLTLLLDDTSLADNILTDAGLRDRLWADAALRRTLRSEFGTFDRFRDVERLIQDRVREIAQNVAPVDNNDVYGRIP